MMKVTEYLTKNETLSNMKRVKESFFRNAESGTIVPDQIIDYTEEIQVLEYELNQQPTVSVSFCIGYRSYFRTVVKIGKSYFCHGEKMTQKRGYRSIEEIAEITEEMNESMISDMYYY